MYHIPDSKVAVTLCVVIRGQNVSHKKYITFEKNRLIEGYLCKIGSLIVLAMNRKSHIWNPMVASDLTLTQVSRSQQLLET